MVVAFCGHSDYTEKNGDLRRALSFLEAYTNGEAADFYLGFYGGFDRFAYSCAQKYKAMHAESSIVFVTPYPDPVYLKKRLEGLSYDSVLYPPIEAAPPRVAIARRNRYVMEQADLLVAYVVYHRGGAYTSLAHARRKGVPIFNLGEGML